MPRLMPNSSHNTLANGAKQLVVQDAWLTPITIVKSSFLPGAEINTFLTVGCSK